ncbi:MULTISPECIES: 30S ribosomal protein S9 [Natrinema]|uniref:Small ribosomal subunit protein uS9 n=3 Tax=Natrinema TaxID=88723 RepID=L9ZKJ6_NATA2|nr:MULTISPECIES: 30S ribosomal protein S9 [Natrinema]AFO56344.1 30S ribosomal protein S9P [Natrinema sp. J7-2]ELY83261.1 30S ribosomal protein S9P [Natrinema gari JCM 14663]ELY86072.1 30S ribosomal protein S9P [Natrinema altunense JCM 12890]RZH66656.1 30S ribosomal protein S9 [Natrinema altunense]
MVTNTSGKKKTAVARATVREGEGRVRINSQPVELVEPEMSRLKMLEPFRIVGEDLRGEMDIDVRVEGGGISGQADAVRTAIARGIVQHSNDAELRDAFMEFDRSLLVNDVRQSEPKKWGGPGARARYQKSYR